MQAEMNQISTLFQQGNLDAARKLCRSLVNKHPNDDKIRYAHAMICQQAGDTDAAIAAYQTTVKISPSHLQALANLGGLLVSAGRYDEAVEPLSRALKLQPNSAPARYNLAQAFHGQGDLLPALAEAEKARALDDKVPDIHSFIGKVCEDMHNHVDAAIAYAKLASLTPEVKGPILLQASNLQMSGKFDEAEDILNRALKRHPDDPEVHLQLANGKRSSERESASISVLAKAIEGGGLEEADQVRMRFALGDLLDRAGDYDEAFTHYEEANRLKKKREPYDSETYVKTRDEIFATFTPSFFAERKGFGHESAKPVFVFGMPRSGTTLLERLLASHPDVAGVGELDHFTARCRQNKFGPLPKPLSDKDVAARSKQTIGEYADSFLRNLPDNGVAAARVVDSTPGNIIQVGPIRLTFPHAHLIYSQRNPIDTALSAFFRNFLENSILYSNSLTDIAVVLRCQAQLVDFYENDLGLNVQRAKYENVVADTEGHVSSLLTHIGMEAGEASFDNTASGDSIRSASLWQARQPVYKTSVEKWRNYEKFLGPFIDALGDLAPAG